MAYRSLFRRAFDRLSRSVKPALGKPVSLVDADAFRHFWQQKDDLFEKVQADQTTRDQIGQIPYPDRRYVIFFTPRSGSSRLGNLIGQTGYLYDPGEPFNPDFVPKIAKGLHAKDIASYVDGLLRKRNRNATFGCEITFRQLHNVFGSMGSMLDLLRPTSCFWLIREDLVAQAVSLSRRQQTQISHSPQADANAQMRGEEMFSYDAKTIKLAVEALCWQENRMEELFVEHGLSPLRISYETTVRCDPDDLLGAVAGHVGLKDGVLRQTELSHEKLKGTKSAEFIQRFKRENAAYVEFIQNRRKERLEALRQIARGSNGDFCL